MSDVLHEIIQRAKMQELPLLLNYPSRGRDPDAQQHIHQIKKTKKEKRTPLKELST
jgi:hypothetical protein